MSKVCIYCIAKNEEAFVERFMEAAKYADLVVVGDTGSTDGTVEAFRRCGAVVHNITISPWRFDVARNAVIDLIPAEYDCLFSVDVDETIENPDWKERILAAWEGKNRLRYWYSWRLNADGSPAKRFVYDKIHSRNFRWVSPVHEVLEATCEERGGFVELELYHRPDHTKSRGSYMWLLEMAVKERPRDDRILHYYGRELYFAGRNAEAIPVLTRHALLPHAWGAERAASFRMAGECFGRLGRWGDAIWAYQKGVEVCPGEREPWVSLATAKLNRRDYAGCYVAAKQAIKTPKSASHYLVDRYAQQEGPYDLAGVAAWWIGKKEEAVQLLTKAHELNASDARIAGNYQTFCTTMDAAGLVHRAIEKWGVGDYAGSRDDYFSARKLDSSHPLVTSNAHWSPEPRTEKPAETGAYRDAVISVLVVSQGRPDLAWRLLESAIDTAERPDKVEVLVATDVTDARRAEYVENFGRESVVVGVPTMVKWNQMAGRATGDILVLVCDDVIFESKGWDAVLRDWWPNDGVAVMYSDAGSGCRLLEFPVISRRMMEAVGYAAYPGLLHSGLDTWWSLIGSSIDRLYYLGDVWVLNHAHVSEAAGIRSRSSRYAEDAKKHAGSLADYDKNRRGADVELLRNMVHGR
jgi:tetratricopeptide (TPR) repeat protein